MMIIVSWDGHTEINDGVNCTALFNNDYGLPTLQPLLAERHNAAPVISGVKFPTDYTLPILKVQVENTIDPEPIRRQLHQWFDGKDGRARPLIVSDVGGGNEREIHAVPLSLVQIEGGGSYQFFVTLKPDGARDPHYRLQATTETLESWTVTSSGQTHTVNNPGQDEAYPTITLTPTSAKASGYTYKRWVPIKWVNEVGVTQYPIEITGGGLNTATLVSGGKMQADGDDIIVEVNGSQVNRWLGGMNTSSTKIWIPLSFQYYAPVTLVTDLDAGAVTSIEVSGDISAYPSSGILMIGTEAIQYTSKVDNKSQFVGITRGAHGTTAAAHSPGAQVDLIQHSVYMLYGNPSATFSQPSSTKQPIFDLTNSTNESWVYDFFGETAVSRMGAWSYYIALTDYAYAYSTGGTGTKALTSPWDYLGIGYSTVGNIVSAADVIFENVCGIDEVDITSGEIYVADEIASWGWALYHYGWVDGVAQTADTTAFPASSNTLLGWTQTIDLTGLAGTPTRYSFSFQLRGTPGTGFTSYVGVNTVTVTLNSANTPVVTMNGEASNYPMAATITNNTTGEAITVSFNMALDETLEIDTLNSTVVYLADNSNQGQAVRRVGSPRQFWLPLAVGNNEIQFDDTGTGNVDVVFSFRKRYYT